MFTAEKLGLSGSLKNYGSFKTLTTLVEQKVTKSSRKEKKACIKMFPNHWRN